MQTDSHRSLLQPTTSPVVRPTFASLSLQSFYIKTPSTTTTTLLFGHHHYTTTLSPINLIHDSSFSSCSPFITIKEFNNKSDESLSFSGTLLHHQPSRHWYLLAREILLAI